MRKKLLKPPQNHREIIFLPELKEFLDKVSEESVIGTAHQPYFFHPGVSIKFIFLNSISKGKKKPFFLDTDRLKLIVRLSGGRNYSQTIELVDSDNVLDGYPTPGEEEINRFFDRIDKGLKESIFADRKDVFVNFFRFREIFLKNSRDELLKNVLVRSFLQFYGLDEDFCFVSDLTGSKEFQEFFLNIYRENRRFREVFNTALDEYKKGFRFRYKNFPFPKLAEDELPFWIINGGKREKCYKKDVNPADIKKVKIFPRAVTLTTFLRLYKLDFFIHGVSGANYEWVQDRIIERFYGKNSPSFAVISGTYLLDNSKQRNLPYFLFSPEKIKEWLYSFLEQRR